MSFWGSKKDSRRAETDDTPLTGMQVLKQLSDSLQKIEATLQRMEARMPLYPTETPTFTTNYAGNATQTVVAASITSVLILAANPARLGAAIFNDGNKVLTLFLGSGSASAVNRTVQVPAAGYYELPYDYTGPIQGIWNNANGSARVTEFTP